MNYRGKDKLAEALKKGLLETARPKKDEPVISEALAARLAAYQEPSNETVKDISGVASALTPKRQPWEIVEEKKPVAPVIVESKAPQKTLKEISSTVRLNKVEEKPLIINESTDSIAGVLTNQGKRLWRPSRKESLEEKVERLESELSLFEEGSHEYLKKIHAGATTKRHDGWSEHVISHGGKKYRLVTNGVRAAMENYRGHVVPHKKVASIVSKLAESVEEYSEDGRGRHKVNYIHPDKKNIGNDRFETRAEATRYANALKKKGYHNVTIGESVEQLDEGNADNKAKKNDAMANAAIKKRGYMYNVRSKAEQRASDLKDARKANKEEPMPDNAKSEMYKHNQKVMRSRGYRVNVKRWMKEDVEQLDEFKKGEDIGKPGLNFKKVAAKAAKEYGSKAAGKRVAGAVLQKILHKEEIEQLDELSLGKMKDYRDKAIDSMNWDYLDKKTYDKRKKGVDLSDKRWAKKPMYKKAAFAAKFHAKNLPYNASVVAGRLADGNIRGLFDDINHEGNQLNEETEPKHKFNKVLAKHGYVYKGTHTEKSLGGRDHDFPSHNYEHPTTGSKVHVWQQKGSADTYHTRHKQTNGITAPGHGDTKGQLDRNLERWAKYKDGLERSGLREEVEQLDELKASTLGRYIRKSQKDASVLPQKIEAEKEGDRHWPEPYKHGPKLQRKLNNRNTGMDRAERALDRKDKKLKEEVEQLDELSADALTKYGDKAWRSKMNAHIDRGGADYLDDDKARKTATRTIGKRERGLALAKAMMKKKSLNEAKYSSGDVVSVDFGWSHSIGLPTSTGHVLHDSDGPVVYASFGHGEFAKQVPLSLDKIKSHTKRRK